MSSTAAVLVCVLSLLGRAAVHLPAIELVDVPPPGVSTNAEAFVRRNPDTICLITSTPTYRAARRAGRLSADRDPFIKLASIIMHEAWHVRYGRDERGAYEAQLTTLAMLGAGPGTELYHGVTRSMLAVLKAQKPSPQPRILISATN